MSPTQQTLRLLRDCGFIVEIVEKRIPHINISKDLFGIADIMAINRDYKGFLLVQTTTDGNRLARIKKATDPLHRIALETILICGGHFQVISWGSGPTNAGRRIVELSLGRSRKFEHPFVQAELDLPMERMVRIGNGDRT